MLIYAVADVHGKPDRIETIRNTISETRPDVLVVAGDITNIRNSVTVIKQLNALPVPVLAIRGNTDLPRVDGLLEQYPNTVCLHLKEHIINGIGFVGVSGTIPLPFRSKLGFAENRILNNLSDLRYYELEALWVLCAFEIWTSVFLYENSNSLYERPF